MARHIVEINPLMSINTLGFMGTPFFLTFRVYRPGRTKDSKNLVAEYMMDDTAAYSTVMLRKPEHGTLFSRIKSPYLEDRTKPY